MRTWKEFGRIRKGKGGAVNNLEKGLFCIAIVVAVLFIFSSVRTVGICNSTDGYHWNSFWGYCEAQEYNDWKCSVVMKPNLVVYYGDTNSVVDELRIEMPCTEAQARNLVTTK